LRRRAEDGLGEEPAARCEQFDHRRASVAAATRLRTAQPLNAFFFAPAMHLSATGNSKLANIFSTHPSLERRLAELDKVQQQLGRTAG
jgi:heat shock protein HtpX